LVGRSHFQVYRFGRAREDERVDRIESPIILDVPMRAGDRPVRVELHGRTELVADELSASITPMVKKDKPTAKDFLAGFLDAVVLSLLPGRKGSDEYHAHVIAGGPGDPSKMRRVFHGIDEARAREFLISLIADLLGAKHAYLLPCEAVFDYLSKQRPIASSVVDMKEDENAPCSSRYGPVPHFEEYDPPDEERARAIIERRFGLFKAAGGMDS
jgi:exodeoxyribonuclease V gamma subunit